MILHLRTPILKEEVNLNKEIDLTVNVLLNLGSQTGTIVVPRYCMLFLLASNSGCGIFSPTL